MLRKEITISALLELGVKLGLIVEGESGAAEKMIELANDDVWTYTETERRLMSQLSAEAEIIITPIGWFNWGDTAPLLGLLREGKADSEVQTWIADMIEQGGFARRKTWASRVEELGSFGDAIVGFSFVKELLKERGPRYRAHNRAMRVISLRHEIPIAELEQYFKRGSKDRHRVLSPIPRPFEQG
jgi:hypothetical protein